MVERTAFRRFQLPGLKRYFVAWAIIMIALLIVGSSYLDWQRQSQTDSAKRIQTYNQQLERVQAIMDNLRLLQGQPNQVVRDKLIQLLNENIRRLNHDQQAIDDATQIEEANENPRLQNEKELAEAINEFSRKLSLSLARLSVSDPSLKPTPLYQNFTSIFQTVQQKNNAVTESLSSDLEQANESYRVLVWSMVSVIIFLMILSGVLLYRQISGLMQEYAQLVENDNTHRRRSEETMRRQTKLLEREQRRVESILNSAVDAILTVSEKGYIESFNPAAQRLFGYASQDILGEKLQMLVVGDSTDSRETFIERVMTDPDGYIAEKGREVSAVHQSGKVFPALVSVGEIYQSSPKTYTVVFTDLTTVNSANDSLKKALEEVNAKQEVLDEEARLAQNVFEKITAENKTRTAGLNHWIQPLGAFSGDVVLSTELPNGVMRVMLCDFTGHGLPAAIGAVPLSMIYSAMTRKGLPIELVMQELNDKLIKGLPGGIFCSISCIDINSKRRVASIWNAGLPNIKLIDAEGRHKHRFKSRHLPLGIQNYTVEEMRCETVRFDDGDSFYLFSDGLTESTNPAGEQFGHTVFDQTLNTPISETGRLAEIHRRFTQFTADEPVKDDVSIIEINTLITTRPHPLKTYVFSQPARV